MLVKRAAACMPANKLNIPEEATFMNNQEKKESRAEDVPIQNDHMPAPTRRRSFRFISLLIAAALLIAATISPASAADYGYSYEVTGTVTLSRSFTDTKGRFCMEFDASNLDNGLMEACLIDSSGVVIDVWNALDHVNSGSSVKYTYPRDYASTPSGTYTMQLTYSNLWGAKSWSFSIKHTQKSVMTLKESFKILKDDGSYAHKIAFNLTGATGKSLTCEIYTKDGKLLRQYSCSSFGYTSGTWTIKWDYFPKSGLKVGSGDYLIKYWVQGGTPKQSTISVQV
jgi:hypothetical protein